MTAGTPKPEPGRKQAHTAQVWAEIAQATVTPSLSMFCKLTNILLKTSVIITYFSLHTNYLTHALLLLLHPTLFQPKYSYEARDSYWWVNIDETVDSGYEMPHKLMAGLHSKPSTHVTRTLSLISVEELNLKFLKTIHRYSDIKNSCIM